MLTLGFTNTFYTLWEVSEPYQYWIDAHHFEWRQTCDYRQNLSKTREAAVEKIKALANQSNASYSIDLNLRGTSSFVRTLSTGDTFEVWQFTFGMLIGSDIRTCDNVYHIERAMSSERNIRTRAIAKRRLIDLGKLVRCTWYEETGLGEFNGSTTHTKRLYTDPFHANRLKAIESSCYYFNDGDKIQLEIKLISTTGFSTAYGYTFVHLYITPDGKKFKYVGSNPPDVPQDTFITVKATVKHEERCGAKENKLQRIKILA